MKTIAITSFHTLISRNLFVTGLLDRLKKRNDLRVILVVPDFKVKYFEERFGGNNVLIYGAEQYRSSKYFWGLFFKRLGMMVYPSGTARMKKSYQYYWDRKLLKYWFGLLMGFIGKSFFARRIIRYFDALLSPRDLFKDLFENYKIDLIFSTDIQNENDVSLAQDALRRKIPILGMLRSWDNTTQRILRVWPDKLLVGSRALYEEAWQYYRYPREKMVITGNPHYDAYLSPIKRSRSDFFRSFGFDPNKKLIVFAPSGSLLIHANDYDQYVMKALAETAIQTIVRFPLGGDVSLVNFDQPKNMVYDRPGERFISGKEPELRSEDDERLREELYYADLIVTGPTSVLLDALFFDKPVIAADFYPTERHKFEKCWGFLNAHIINFLGFNAAIHAETKDDFLSAVKKYLENPEIDSRGRAEARAHWFSHIDGKSTDRLESEIINMLESV